MKVDMTALRTAILDYRKHNGISQEQLAKAIGISRNGLAKIERGETNVISLKVLGRIETVIDIKEN